MSSMCAHQHGCANVSTGMNVCACLGISWTYDGWMCMCFVFVYTAGVYTCMCILSPSYRMELTGGCLCPDISLFIVFL